MKTVELKMAYHWNCEDCGADNFAVAARAEFAPGEREELYRDYHGMASYETLPENWEQFELVSIPEIVTCTDCKAEFKTIHEMENPECL